MYGAAAQVTAFNDLSHPDHRGSKLSVVTGGNLEFLVFGQLDQGLSFGRIEGKRLFDI